MSLGESVRNAFCPRVLPGSWAATHEQSGAPRQRFRLVLEWFDRYLEG